VCVLRAYAPHARVRSRPGRPAGLRTPRTGTLPAWASCGIMHPTHGYACRLARPAGLRTPRTGTLPACASCELTHPTHGYAPGLGVLRAYACTDMLAAWYVLRDHMPNTQACFPACAPCGPRTQRAGTLAGMGGLRDHAGPRPGRTCAYRLERTVICWLSVE